MARLPIDERLEEIVRTVRAGRDVVIAAPPGSGKTTRVPAALLDAVDGAVVVLEPRRVAARMAARRVAEERGGRVGDEVGYRVRFESSVGARTRLVFQTEGTFLRRLLDDPAVEGTSVVVFDEFHERSLDAELLLGMLREVKETLRDDLRLVLMSATFDATAIAAGLGAARVEAEGRPYPVEVEYAPRRKDERLEDAVARAVAREVERADSDGARGVLVFLPGVGEIERARRTLEPLLAGRGVDVLPLHGELPAAAQDAAVRGGERPRVVLATNVAETSLTLDGVACVVDSGEARVLRRRPGELVDALRVEPISRASADQRAGRAGRQGPGRCVRLFAESAYRGLPAALEPEVLRVDLTGAVLTLRAWGVRDPASFPWLTPPPPGALESAGELLGRLGAVDAAGAVTAVGRRLAALPVHPRLARMLDEARRVGAGEDAAVVAALAAARRVRRRVDPTVARSDLLVLLDLYHRARAARFDRGTVERLGLDARAVRAVDREARQLSRLVGRGGGGGATDEALLRCVAAGFPDRVARRREPGSARALTAAGFEVELDPASAVRDEDLFVAVDAVAVGRGRPARVRRASGVDPEWLEELFPAAVASVDETVWNEARGKAEGRRRKTFGALVLEERPLPRPDPERAAALLAEAATHPRRLARLRDERLAGLLARLDCLRRARPELELPTCDDDDLREVVAAACAGLSSLDELERAPLGEHLKARLGPDVGPRLDRLVPAAWTVPSGRKVPIVYREGQPPVVAARLQEWFGTAESPRIADGRVALVLDLLAPNGRSVQITSDLANFWATLYPRERRELARRYPRHAWPDDPLAAAPTSRPVPRRR
ncbi:MAG: ATP-dependent helicase HrpB [Planctomycetota bacterium JB042]